ncbi:MULTISPECIES: LysR family transcriptional regulator [unclassified Janthinobacterium]|uniref:LysR family transcriptional regulator n=1 Tax=unclassified Janthinobacterium TaxID=2610881 RepID=UPI0003483F32|nr:MULTISPECIES: LysR family transcriptional regulator [unclassified Janthinobacterium]MEC5159524.1 DNA-binding transcriptional LysR family regulator [Janthinobacterium sp. CG_S6]
MKDQLDLNHLRYFVAIVDAGSFAGAARAMALPTSNVSRHLAQLEDSLSARLLERHTRALRLTETGRQLYQRARPMMDDMAALERELRHSDGAFSGTLKLCLPAEFGARLLGPVVAEFCAAHPRVDIECHTGMAGRDVVRDDVDVSILFRRGVPDDSAAIQLPLLSLASCVVAAPQLLARCGVPVTTRQLQQLPCISTLAALNGTPWHFVDAGGRARPVAVRARYRVDSGDMARAAALAGVGFAMLAEASCAAEIERGALVRLDLELRPAPLELVAAYPSRRHLSGKTRALLDLMQLRLRQWRC